jgi:hypothetical protein
MTATLSAIGAVLGLILLWAGIKHLRVSTLVAAVLSAGDLLALALTLISLGWLGLVLFVGVNVAGFVAWGAVHGARIDQELAYAATQAAVEPSETEAVYRWLTKRPEVTPLGARRHARVVRLLSERGRSPADVYELAVPIELLWLVHRPPLDWLVEQFDCLLRLYGEPATEAERIADVLSAASQRSAATFEQLVVATVTAAGGSADLPAARAA